MHCRDSGEAQGPLERRSRGRLVLLAIRTTIADDRRQAGSYGFGVHMRLSGGVT